MTPSLEIREEAATGLWPTLKMREEAAMLFEAAWRSEEEMVKAEDAGASDEQMAKLEQACLDGWFRYERYCDLERFELLTEASGGIIRCARTKITLCDLDEVEELESGELVLKAAEHAAA